jgi:hypothetical protein
MSARFPVDRLSDKLVNDKVNKYSAYYWWGNLSFLHNGLVLKIVKLLFGKRNGNVLDNHAGLLQEGVKEKNALFLYSSR